MSNGLDICIVAEGRAFDPRRLLDEPLGGMQTATVGIAKALADLGHRVRVFAPVPEAVSYYSALFLPVSEVADAGGDTDVLITVRRLLPLLLPIKARSRILWLHDAPTHPLINQGSLFFKLESAVGGTQTCGIYSLLALQKTVDKFFAISAWQAEEHCRRFGLAPDRFFLTANGVDLGLIDSCRLARDPRRLLYCSAPNKGLDILLRVWPAIRARVSDATLRVCSSRAGYGEPEQARPEWLDGHDLRGVEFTGFVPPRLLVEEMKRASILAYPNHEPECHSISVAQAAAAGMAIVTSAYGGLTERIEHGVDGILIPGSSLRPGYEEAFVNAVVDLLEHPESARRLGEAARLRSWSESDWNVIARAWEAELKATCDGRPRRFPDLSVLNLSAPGPRTVEFRLEKVISRDEVETHFSVEARRYGFASALLPEA